MPFRHGHRLPRQLAQESDFSLRNHWSTISGGWHRVARLGFAHGPRPQQLDLVMRYLRKRHRVSAGMALREAFCVKTLTIVATFSLRDLTSWN